MASLIVRKLDRQIVLALKQRAAVRGHSAEQEHREILKSILSRPPRQPVQLVMATIDIGARGSRRLR